MVQGTGDGEARHPIGVVSERTGLTADVLRAWERRYGVVTPARSPGGQRLYTDADVERLSLLHRATLGGRSIGQVAGLDPASLVALVREDEAARVAAPARERGRGSGKSAAVAEAVVAVDEAFALLLALRPEALERRLRRALADVGVAGFLESVVAPLFRRVGEGWHAGQVTPAQEHMATAVARRVLEWSMALLSVPADAPRVVVATPEGDRHEIGALLAAAAAAEAGWAVTYLGADLPLPLIAETARRVDAEAVALSAVYADGDGPLMGSLKSLRGALPADVPLLVGGAAAMARSDEVEAAGALPLNDLAAFRAVLSAAAGA